MCAFVTLMLWWKGGDRQIPDAHCHQPVSLSELGSSRFSVSLYLRNKWRGIEENIGLLTYTQACTQKIKP